MAVPCRVHLKTQISRELDWLELLLQQIKAVETERDALLAAQQVTARAPAAMCSTSRASGPSSPPPSGRKGCSDTSTIDGRSLGPLQPGRRIGDVALLVHVKAIFNEIALFLAWKLLAIGTRIIVGPQCRLLPSGTSQRTTISNLSGSASTG